MPIISLSLPDELVSDMDHAIAQGTYKGRSEFLRAAIKTHLQQTPTTHGHIHGSITVTYPHGKEGRLADVRHAHHDVVLSMMHTHCEPETCMDVLIVGGPSERVTALQETLTRLRDVHRSQLVVMA